MSNSYFRFKQFYIDQEHCAMKVTTDACIQGAWTPLPVGSSRVLDIGTGTGLLALMIAQRNPTIHIDAIELDTDAAKQASRNVAGSPWSDRMSILEGDVCTYPFAHKYDLIISNPPFFNNSLLGDKQARNNARHTLSLSHTDLLAAIDQHLSPGGFASVLLPYAEYLEWYKLIEENGWTESERLSIRHTPGAVVKRVVCIFSRNKDVAHSNPELIIKGSDNNYTADFISLLADYYLDL